MTQLLDKALKRIGAQSGDGQNAIAARILETLDDEETWRIALSKDPAKLRRLASEALDEYRRGETRPSKHSRAAFKN